jgi:PadR family transcriptional regulator PadR
MGYPYVEFASMGTNEPRLTQQTLKVLGALISGHVRELSGADIAKLTQLPSGTLYPIVHRLEEVGWVESKWEVGDPVTLGRPRRRYYRVTAEGARRVREVVRELTPSNGRAVWA